MSDAQDPDQIQVEVPTTDVAPTAEAKAAAAPPAAEAPAPTSLTTTSVPGDFPKTDSENSRPMCQEKRKLSKQEGAVIPGLHQQTEEVKKDKAEISTKKSTFMDPIEAKGMKKQGFLMTKVKQLMELLDAKEEGKRLKTVLRCALDDNANKLSGVDVVCLISNAASIVFFLGGLSQFKSKTKERLYCTCWAACFLTCATLCFLNLIYYQQVPFHNFPIDFLTSYVHIPAFFAWRFWRRYLQTTHSMCLVQDVLLDSTEFSTAVLVMASRAAFIVTLVAMCGMSGVVLIGYAHAPFELAHHGMADDLQYTSFMWWHGAIMYVIIPPVISSVFCSYSMIMFFSGLHIMDVYLFSSKLDLIMGKVNDDIRVALAERQPFEVEGFAEPEEGKEKHDDDSDSKASSASGFRKHIAENFDKSRQRKQKRMANLQKMHDVSGKDAKRKMPGAPGSIRSVSKDEEGSSENSSKGRGADGRGLSLKNISFGSGEFMKILTVALSTSAEAQRVKHAQDIFDDAMEEVSLLAVNVQHRLHTSCSMWSTTSMHLLLFSICQVLIVTGNARLHTLGSMADVPYTYHWVLMDMFHLASGFVLITLNMGTGACVTGAARARVLHLLRLAEALDVGRSQIAAFMVLLQNRITGYVVWGQPVDAQKCIMISFAVFVLIINNITEILNTKVNMEGNHVAGKDAPRRVLTGLYGVIKGHVDIYGNVLVPMDEFGLEGSF